MILSAKPYKGQLWRWQNFKFRRNRCKVWALTCWLMLLVKHGVEFNQTQGQSVYRTQKRCLQLIKKKEKKILICPFGKLEVKIAHSILIVKNMLWIWWHGWLGDHLRWWIHMLSTIWCHLDVAKLFATSAISFFNHNLCNLQVSWQNWPIIELLKKPIQKRKFLQ